MSDAVDRPGKLVLVVGASGVGKDTVLKGAQAYFITEARVCFAQRTITRQPDASEASEYVSEAEFALLRDEGAFALSWWANDLCYGIRKTIEMDLELGRSVVCNVSRTVLDDARLCFAQVRVVEIVASPSVLAQRLQARGREASPSIEARLRRTVSIGQVEADAVIVNEAHPDLAIASFCSTLEGWLR